MKRQAFNPYLPSGEYVPDGEPHVFGDRIYIYGSHDRAGGATYCENDYISWSAPLIDPSDWRYEGIIFRREQDPMNADGRMELWAPDIMQGKDERYYLYYCFPFQPFIGVAVCDSPCGKFEFYGHVQYGDGTIYGMREDDTLPFDPAVLNDDGRFYLYSNYSQDVMRMLPPEATQPVRDGRMTLEQLAERMAEETGVHFPITKLNGEGSMVLELADDMLTVLSVKPLIPGIANSDGTGFEGHEFYEASSIRKIDGRYYFVYSSYLSHELAYAVSDRPDEGFVYGGMITSNGDIGYQGRTKEEALNYFGNNHGGLENINGQWYIFYHRQTNCNEQSRQGCAEPVTIAADGTIAPVEITSCGLNGGPLRGEGTYPAYIACNLRSKNGACKYDVSRPEIAKALREENPYITQDIEDIEVPVYGNFAQYIKNMKNGSVAGFKYFDIKRVTALEATVRGDAGTLRVLLSPDSDSVGESMFEASAEWQKVRIPVNIPDGEQAVYFMALGDGSFDLKEFAFLTD
ncbi:MAG: family 43 glycosylhydrolase [Clostridiales bacterium]|nr:family 43 glycosylhydrolase [Clostridiales bacterium]